MKSFLATIGIIAAFVLLALSGCELTTQTPPPNTQPVGHDLIIDEVFTIAPSKFYAYSWLEVYNPSDHKIQWADITKPYSAFVVGQGGAALKTDDDGATWRSIYNGSSINFNGVSFPYPDTGYIVGDGGVMMRVQADGAGGYNFRQITLPTVAGDLNINDVTCNPLSPAGYLVGDSGLILWTIDKGLTWRLQRNWPSVQNLHAVNFVSFSSIYAVGDSSAILKQASAQLWSIKNPPPLQVGMRYNAISFNFDTGWIAGEKGGMAISRNGGGSWSQLNSGTGANLHGIFFSGGAGFSPRMGWAVGDSGIILKTLDYGDSWEQLPSPVTSALYDVKFADSMRGIAVGDGGVILATTNGGRSWSTQPSGTTNNLRKAFITPLLINQYNAYVFEIWGQRKSFFWQQPYCPNFDVITQVDTGLILYEPGLFSIFLPQCNIEIGGQPDPLPPGGFAIIQNDSIRFKDHVATTGPASPILIKSPLMINARFALDSTATPGDVLTLWDLLESGEVRIMKYFQRRTTLGTVLAAGQTTIDVVRWGGFMPKLGYFYDIQRGPDYPDSIFAQNHPAGLIPEWYSMARYSNDVGGDPRSLNTAASFYMTDTPTPGWFSQKRKP